MHCLLCSVYQGSSLKLKSELDSEISLLKVDFFAKISWIFLTSVQTSNELDKLKNHMKKHTVAELLDKIVEFSVALKIHEAPQPGDDMGIMLKNMPNQEIVTDSDSMSGKCSLLSNFPKF